MEPTEPTPDPVLPLDLLAAGDPRFVVALRTVHDAGALARFAAPWYADPRPEARHLLFAYLDEPPNAPGHEGLIKRLFKLAEAAADDAVLARFLVLCDRLIPRRRPVAERFPGKHFKRDPRSTPAAPATTLPRPDSKQGKVLAALTLDQLAGRRWFSVATRRYLQRRVWRYFRTLGRTDPDRYTAAAAFALGLYRDAELPDGIALLERFGLIHLLFATSPALRLHSAGWDVAPGHSLAELAPGPAFATIWHDRPEAVLPVLIHARAAVIARWAVRWIEADRNRFAAVARPADWVTLLDRTDPEVVRLALAMLDALPDDQLQRAMPPAAWTLVVERAAPAQLGPICDLAARLVQAGEVPRAVAVRLALSRFEPLARLGWNWITGQEPPIHEVEVTPEDAYGQLFPRNDPQVRIEIEAELHRLFPHGGPQVWDQSAAFAWILFPLIDAPCLKLRRSMREFIGQRIEGSPLQVDWVWGLLHSPDAEARALGQMQVQSVRDDPAFWDRMIATPPPDVTAWAPLLTRPAPLADPRRLDPVLAALVLQPHGAARVKPAAIRQIVARLAVIPVGSDADAETNHWLDLLATVARSARAPERRSALAALVTLADRRPDWQGRIAAAVPALLFDGEPGIVPS